MSVTYGKEQVISKNRLGRTSLLVMVLASLGGILYGYDIGIISGALLYMKVDLGLTSQEMSLIVSAVLGGGSVATLISGPFADRFGRRLSLITSASVFIVGVVVVMFAQDFAWAITGRVIQGVGVGIITIVVPMYIAEIIPPTFRGRSITLFQLCLTLGILLGYLIGYAFNASGNWRAMFATALAPSGLFLIGGLILPHSPRWFYMKGRLDDARRLLMRTHSPEEVNETMGEMEKLEQQMEGRTQGWRELLQPGYKRPFLIALAIGILNQLTGINTLLQFSTVILHQSGLHGGSSAVLGSVAVGGINFLVTLVALALIDRVGRKPLLMLGTAGTAVSLFGIGFAHLLALPAPVEGYATLAGMLAFIIFFAVGPGVVVWVVLSEILPTAIRGKGMAIALFANSLVSAGLAAIFATLTGWIGYSGTFFLLAFFVCLYFLVAVFPLPETKDRTLEEIEAYFLSAAKVKGAGNG